jgi:hypothetical protein
MILLHLFHTQELNTIEIPLVAQLKPGKDGTTKLIKKPIKIALLNRRVIFFVYQ